MSYIDKKYLFRCETCRHLRRGECSVFCESGECYTPSLAKIPNVDVAEVVRCKDCIYSFGSAVADLMFCSAPLDTFVRTHPNHFCSKGEREGETDA